MNYNIADFVIRIKNAALANRKSVILPFSNINKEIGKTLIREKFLEDLKEEVKTGKKVLVAKIRYNKRIPVLTDVEIVSKPSLRVYATTLVMDKILKKSYQTLIFSTSYGVMTGKEARKRGVGGELLFKIW